MSKIRFIGQILAVSASFFTVLVLSITVSQGAGMLKPVNPEGVNIPGISQAMIVDSGKLMFLSGHVPMGADGKIKGATVAEQLEQVLANMERTLKAANADFSSLVRVTVYVKDYDVSKLAGIRKVRDKWLNMKNPPASALIGVKDLFVPNALVEVDAVAVISNN